MVLLLTSNTDKDKILPIVATYLNLIKKKKSPYYDIACHLIKEMEKTQKQNRELYNITYVVNAKKLEKELTQKISKIKAKKRLTATNIARTILAIIKGGSLQEGEEYHITIRKGGGKNYHIKINQETLGKLKTFVSN